MSNTDTAVMQHSRGVLLGIGVCPKCRVINKIRSIDEINENMTICPSCGAKVPIEKRMKH